MTTVNITGVPERKGKDKEAENLLKVIMAKNFLNLGTEMDIQIHEAQKQPKMLNLKTSTPRHNKIKLSKSK